MRVEVLDESADSWVALLFFLGFGLFMIVVMVPEFRVYWPQGQMFSVIGGLAVNPLLYEFVIIGMVLMIAMVLAGCVYLMLRQLPSRKRKREAGF